MSSDTLRPTLHFLPERNWINDPNGLIFWRGRHHLFYQHNPVEAKHGNIVWGHASSVDLHAWTHHPIALRPDQPYDQGGCYSGCAVAPEGDDGPLWLVYTGVKWGQGDVPTRQTQCLATSDDGVTFRRLDENPVVADPPAGIHPRHFRDPFVWRDPTDVNEPWRMVLTGSTEVDGEYGGDACVLQYRGRSLSDWRFDEELLRSPRKLGWWAHECPNLIEIDGRRFLITSPHISWRSWWWSETSDGSFHHDYGRRLDQGDCFYAPLTWRHEGRVLMLGWLRESRPGEECLAAGWAGCLSLPRELYVTNEGGLGQRPVEEVLTWRSGRASDRIPAADGPLEVVADAQPGSVLTLDYEGGRGWRFALPVPPDGKPGHQHQRYRVFVDRSVIEIFAGDGTAATYRLYPGETTVKSGRFETGGVVQAWRLDPLHHVLP